jgi:hypothetical protein
MSAHRHKTWGEAAGLPETAARLDRLPEGLEFPEDFPEPIRYQPQRRCLVYRGFMSSASYAFLRGRSTDRPYLVAVDELFQASAFTVPTGSSVKRVLPWLISASCLGAATAVAWTLLR